MRAFSAWEILTLGRGLALSLLIWLGCAGGALKNAWPVGYYNWLGWGLSWDRFAQSTKQTTRTPRANHRFSFSFSSIKSEFPSMVHKTIPCHPVAERVECCACRIWQYSSYSYSFNNGNRYDNEYGNEYGHLSIKKLFKVDQPVNEFEFWLLGLDVREQGKLLQTTQL